AISFACSRCLHAHLGSPAATLGSQVSSSSSGFSAAKNGVRGGVEEGDKLLLLLRARCGLNKPPEAWTRPVREITPEEVGHTGTSTCAARAERPRQRQQEDGKCGPALLTYPRESRHHENEPELKLVSVTAEGVASGGDPTSDFAPV
ncbi:unnamed protein product, partial [Ectocarpus sp. 12 AP-2014]